MALPKHIHNHPLAINFRGDVIYALIGSELHCRGLIHHVVDFNLFRRILP